MIGNPQNILIGEVLRLDFAGYLHHAIVPVLLGCVALWAWLAWDLRRRGSRAAAPATLPPLSAATASLLCPAALPVTAVEPAPPFDRWQTAKGLIVVGVLLVVFLATPWPRDVAALVGAGVLLLSQRFHSSRVMGLVDWELLILFMGLFVVNHALQKTGMSAQAVSALQAQGLDLQRPGVLFGAILALSNLVSNVPAVMLLLPVAQHSAAPAQAGATLALVSTLAGNLLIVGSIANIIVVDAARRAGIVIDWRRHARTGVPVTLLTLFIAAVWLVAAAR